MSAPSLGEGDPGAPPKLSLREILADPPVRTIVGVVFVVMLGFGIVIPILPLFARSFGVGFDAASLLISAFAFTRLVFDLVAGPIVDRFGERAAAASGIAFVAVSSIATALAPTFTLAVIFRGVGGAGSAVLFGALFSYMLKVVPKDRMGRTLSVFFGTFNLGVIAGGPVGGFVAHRFGLRSPLYVYAGLLLVAAVLFMRFVRNPSSSQTAEPDLSPEEALAEREMPILRRTRVRVGRLVARPGFVTACVLNFAYLWMIGGIIDTLVPLFGAEGLGMSEAGIGIAFAVTLVAEFAVILHAGALSDRIGRRAVAVPAFAALAVTGSVIGLAPSVLAFGAMLALLGLASGYAGVPPGAMLSDVSPAEGSGTAVGAFRFCGDLALVLAPATAGVTTAAFGFGGAFALASIPVFVAALVVARTPETLRRAVVREDAPEPPLAAG